ncbi:MAG: tRNA (adenosine(37)-N6)-dimethylallyltransferase MiaA [Clostridia bacterium]|nr:tRNA (adenosine(37)-N6)-dimethylallyltransferase MiaA [Clostridia bacterium]
MAKVVVICGATASGKTALSVALAKQLNTEVISADSMLVYKGLDVGTAKPTEAEKEGVIHHMIDVVEPFEKFSVSDYEAQALPLVERLLAQGKTPIICGGTGFYIQALLYKSQFGNAGADEKIRAELEESLKIKGKTYLHELLKEKDPESALLLHENDTKRVIRALEIFFVTGKRKSEQKDERIPRFDFTAFSVDFPRETLYQRIDLRVEKMFEAGLKKEVISLLDQGVSPTSQCMQGIGYKEIVEGMAAGLTDKEIVAVIQKNTRNYAKRQITYFKRMENHVLLSPERANVEEILSTL